ncbi:tetratricopeptide repeat protein [Gallibacterium anatis]|uniref:tetratricopeptide repeat protein n=1 Tax=Gallibacterium anatis TaxID=750 RepID=UPI000A655A61|nr:tetratricopeptide repeat protein [Gallibacterium anatis]WAX71103.1 tetratricopeptide repeat protein [Gallibacterium anatis]
MKFTKKLLITALLSFAVLGTARVAYVAYVQKTQFQQAFDAAKKKDFATALKLWQSLAEQGDANSQYNLGLMYSRGEGVKQDDAEAMKWWRKAAEQGLSIAQYNLGVGYIVAEQA